VWATRHDCTFVHIVSAKMQEKANQLFSCSRNNQYKTSLYIQYIYIEYLFPRLFSRKVNIQVITLALIIHSKSDKPL